MSTHQQHVYVSALDRPPPRPNPQSKRPTYFEEMYPRLRQVLPRVGVRRGLWHTAHDERPLVGALRRRVAGRRQRRLARHQRVRDAHVRVGPLRQR